MPSVINNGGRGTKKNAGRGNYKAGHGTGKQRLPDQSPLVTLFQNANKRQATEQKKNGSQLSKDMDIDKTCNDDQAPNSLIG